MQLQYQEKLTEVDETKVGEYYLCGFCTLHLHMNLLPERLRIKIKIGQRTLLHGVHCNYTKLKKLLNDNPPKFSVLFFRLYLMYDAK